MKLSPCVFDDFSQIRFDFFNEIFSFSHEILLYVIMSYSCLWHSLMTSDLSDGSQFFIKMLSDHFSFLDKYCLFLMSFSKKKLIAFLTFQKKMFTAVNSVGRTQLFLSRNLFFFIKTPGFDSDSKK